jgi:hypothetical protein
MKGKNFRLGERVVVSIDGSPYAGSISRRLDEVGNYWVVWLDGNVMHDAHACDIRRERQQFEELSPEELGAANGSNPGRVARSCRGFSGRSSNRSRCS